jgi:excisionase family DNA binding protein
MKILPAKAQVAEREFIDAREAAAWLGIPLSSFRQYLKAGLIPSYKLGRHRLFRKTELLESMREKRTSTFNEFLS